MSAARLPAPLKKGDYVRIVAPSGAFERARLDAGLVHIAAAGLRPVLDDGLFSRQRYLAGDDARRLAELQHAITDPTCRAIWVARGGYGATRLLPQVTPESIAAGNKWLIGFSDTTALHCAWLRAGVAGLHGANVTTLASWSGAARDELFGWLFEPKACQLTGSAALGGRAVRGRLVGGNITVLASMAGTGTLPSMAGCIVLLEDIGERPYRLDRSLTQLRQAGAFNGVVGFAIGQLTDCELNDPSADYSALEVVLGTLKDLRVPVVSQLPIGHESSSRAVVLGAQATLDPAAGTLTLTPPASSTGSRVG